MSPKDKGKIDSRRILWRDFRLTLRYKWDLRSSGLLRNVD